MIDQTTVDAHGGDGGRGTISFRREKFVPLGGPNGGRGGRGGHVIVVASAHRNTLNRYRHRQIFRATKGQPGSTNNRRGRDGEDLILEVPAGTIVQRVNADGDVIEQLADLSEDGAGVVLARGGRGGQGNTYFKSSTNRAPRVAQKGQIGEPVRALLELRLIADVGVIGLPNAGKSTLLRQISAATPRVAAYPFTTLEPNLGVARVGWEEFVLADLPGLIEGASAGAGLGHEFLRHTRRARLLLHLIDGSLEDPLAAHATIRQELTTYSEETADKPEIVAINKADLEAVQSRRPALEAQFRERGIEPLFLSAVTGEGTQPLAEYCFQELQRLRDTQPPRREMPTIRPRADSRRFSVEGPPGGPFRVRGRQVETFVAMMDLKSEEARAEVYRWLSSRGVTAALRKAGLQPGDSVQISDEEWEWQA